MTENLWRPDCIRTVSGQYVNVITPDPDTINIGDIAHALSNMPRFGGHLPVFYSVGQHSLQVYAEVARNGGSPTVCLQALLHDAAEAYLIDLPTPIKNYVKDYVRMEEVVHQVIMDKYHVPPELHNLVRVADRSRLMWEWETLMLGTLPSNKVFAQRPWEVKNDFLVMFNSLHEQHMAMRG